jgi:hypothetical protein
MSIHVEQFQDIEELEHRLNKLDRSAAGDTGMLRQRLISLQAMLPPEGYFFVVVWQDA